MSKPIPEGWKLRSLDEIADRVITPVQGNPEHVLTISSTAGWVDQRQKWSRDMAGKSLSKYTQLKKGELSYNRGNSKTFPYGCVFKLRDWDVAAVPNVYHSFRAKADKADADFVQYSFHVGQLDAQLRSIITSSARANGLLNITARDFFSIKLPCPPLREQQKIAAILSSVDDVIEKTRAQIDKLKDLKTGMMQELLTKGIGHTEFKDSPVGRIPKEWKSLRFADVTLKIQDGTHFSPQSKAGDYLYITSKNIQNGRLDLRNVSYISKEEHDEIYRRCDVTYGDVLLTKDGANTGNCAINTLKQPFSLLSSVAFLRCDPEQCLNEYLYQYICSPKFQKTIKDSMTGNAITRLTLTLIKNLPVPLPSMVEQASIVSALSSVDSQVAAATGKLVKVVSLKNALMQDLLTGKVRVKLNNSDSTTAAAQSADSTEEQQYDYAE